MVGLQMLINVTTVDWKGRSNQMFNVPGSIVTKFGQFSVGHLR